MSQKYVSAVWLAGTLALHCVSHGHGMLERPGPPGHRLVTAGTRSRQPRKWFVSNILERERTREQTPSADGERARESESVARQDNHGTSH